MNNLKQHLRELSKIVHSKGFITEVEFFSEKKNRNKLYSEIEESFLSFDKQGTPVYPIRDQFGNISISVLERSLLFAKKNRNKEVVNRLMEEINQLHKRKIFESNKIRIKNVRRDLGNL